MSDAILKRASKFWSDRSRDGRTPSRQELDLTSAGDLLAYLVLSEALGEDGEYRHEHAGDSAEALLGAPISSAAANANGDCVQAWRSGLDVVRATGAPHATTFASANGEKAIRALYLPVVRRRDERRPRFVLSVLAEADEDAQR